MRESFLRIDDALIDGAFQPAADWMDRHMGFGPHRAARTAIDLASLAWILAQAGALAAGAGSQDVLPTIIRGALVVMGLWAFTVLRNVFRKSDGGAGGRTAAQANPLRPGMQLHRAACLFWIIALTVKTALAPAGFDDLALLAMGAFTTAAVYIGACTNNPPKWRETRETGRNWGFALGGV